jgi:hypothetical protein
MDPLHHAFWNSHRYIAALESAFAVPPLDHSGLAREHTTNGLLAQVPEAGQFTDGEMSFQRRFADLSPDTAQPIGFGGGWFSCLHGAPPLLGGKIGCAQLYIGGQPGFFLKDRRNIEDFQNLHEHQRVVPSGTLRDKAGRRRRAVGSKLKCPVFVANEMSGYGLLPAAAEAVGKWESRGVCGISKPGGKVGFLTFPPGVFSTAPRAPILLFCNDTPSAL